MKKLHREILLSSVYQLSDDGSKRTGEGSGKSALLARQSASHGCGTDSRFHSRRRADDLDSQDGRSFRAAEAGVSRAARCTEK